MNAALFERPLSHAYIVASQDKALREDTARRLAAAMLCGEPRRPCGHCRHCRKAFGGIHPDIAVVERDRDDKGQPRRELQVGRVRALVADAAVLPNEADRKVYLILDADAMNTSAQNALLKLLEEPPAWVSLILCTPDANALLGTVRSRCVELTENALGEAADDETHGRAVEYLRLIGAGDLPGLLRHLTACEKLKQDAALAFAEEAQAIAAAMLCGERSSGGLEQAELLRLTGLLQKAAKYLRGNVGVKHVMGMLSASSIS